MDEEAIAVEALPVFIDCPSEIARGAEVAEPGAEASLHGRIGEVETHGIDLLQVGKGRPRRKPKSVEGRAAKYVVD